MAGGALGAAVGGGGMMALALALSTPTIEQWEGTRTYPYRDIAGIWTVCTGETRVAMRRYTPAECETMLRRAVEDEFAPAVIAAVPGLKSRPYQLAATISLTYNIGTRGFARSTVARRFNAGNWKGGCDAFLMWVNAGGKRVQGLVNRRKAERELCLTGL